MLCQPNWAALPVEVLRRAFELQPNGWATCAAAVTCATWHEVVKSSRVNDLYLYADTDQQERSWQSLLASRSAIGTLKLVRSATWNVSGPRSLVNRAINTAEATMNSLPTACTSLTLSEFCAHSLSHYVQKEPELEQLSIQWNGLQFDLPTIQQVPSLTALTHLTQLTVQLRNDVYGTMFPALVKRCPDTLQSMTLQGFGSEIEQEQPPMHSVRSLNLLQTHLSALTHLALTQSVVTIPGDDITCLSRLKSLSFRDAEIYVDGELEVTSLTHLTYLDLSGVCCYWEDAWVEAADTFTSWPGLDVLKLSKCNMVDQHTELDVTSVRELHINFPVRYEVTEFQQVHADMSSSHVIANLQGAPRQSHLGNTLFGLHIDIPGQYGTWPVGAILRLVTQNCPSLELLHFSSDVAGLSTVSHFHESTAMPNKLKSLSLSGIACYQVELQAWTSLTQLVLHQVDKHAQLACVSLPSSLQLLNFKGASLFQADSQHNLQSLQHLSRVLFDFMCYSYNLGQMSVMPKLPLSLNRFQGNCNSIVDWSGLHGCTNLEHLTLGPGHWPTGELQAWIKSAHHLHIVDHDNDIVPVVGDEHSELQGIRLQSLDGLDDIPEWLDDLPR